MVKPKRIIEVIDDDMAVVVRRMSGTERLRVADDMFRSARDLIRASVLAAHPHWDEPSVEREVAARIAG